MIRASVVIATYNRAERLRRCLEALAGQTQPVADFEVVVIVDGSTDGTRQLIETFRSPFALRTFWQENSGQCSALNRGAAAARGPVCIFLDDDIVASPDLVAAHLRLHGERGNVVGVGQLTLKLPRQADWFAHSFEREWDAHYLALNQGRPASWQDCYGGNMSVRRDLFLEAGGFDGSLARAYDIELAYRLERLGCSFVYAPEALGDQDEGKGCRALTTDSEQSGVACVELSRRYPSVLPILLGAFREQRPALITALRVLLMVNLSPRRLEGAGPLLQRFVGPGFAYRLLQRYSFWRGVRHALPDREDWRRLLGGTPILMYHAFGVPGEPPSRYVVPVRQFERQMAWLQRLGYHVLGLDDLLEYRSEYRLPPTRSVVITIDDGYADNRTLAYPVLRHYRFPATVFLVSDRVGGTNEWDAHSVLAGRALMRWSDAKEMLSGGVQFGAHTRTHPDLAAIPEEQARDEIEGSRAVLEDRLGVSIRSLAYPYGKYDATLAAIADKSGFQGSCGINAGLNTLATSPHALRRVEIRGSDSLADFALAVHFGARPECIGRMLRSAVVS